MPAIEGIATLGVATAVELHSAHEFEERVWEQIVHRIDPSLKICQLDGLLFNTEEEFKSHLKAHAQQQQAAQNSTMMMGMMGGGLWI